MVRPQIVSMLQPAGPVTRRREEEEGMVVVVLMVVVVVVFMSHKR